jgi:hypothetical protein
MDLRRNYVMKLHAAGYLALLISSVKGRGFSRAEGSLLETRL